MYLDSNNSLCPASVTLDKIREIRDLAYRLHDINAEYNKALGYKEPGNLEFPSSLVKAMIAHGQQLRHEIRSELNAQVWEWLLEHTALPGETK